MDRLRRIDQWAATWQTGEWSLATLPQELGVRVIRFHGGAEVLGLSLVPERVIAITERLDARPERQDVQVHELAHILADPLCPTPIGIELCQYRQSPGAQEVFTWQVAGRVALSRPQYADLEAQRASIREIAAINGVTPLLIEVGCCVHRWLNQPRGSSFEAAAAGAAVGVLWSRLYRLVRKLDQAG